MQWDKVGVHIICSCNWTIELQKKVNCLLKVNCSIQFGLTTTRTVFGFWCMIFKCWLADNELFMHRNKTEFDSALSASQCTINWKKVNEKLGNWLVDFNFIVWSFIQAKDRKFQLFSFHPIIALLFRSLCTVCFPTY